jgi:hypothetical protein
VLAGGIKRVKRHKLDVQVTHGVSMQQEIGAEILYGAVPNAFFSNASENVRLSQHAPTGDPPLAHLCVRNPVMNKIHTANSWRLECANSQKIHMSIAISAHVNSKTISTARSGAHVERVRQSFPSSILTHVLLSPKSEPFVCCVTLNASCRTGTDRSNQVEGNTKENG